ncbi:phage head-tail joining protein [Bradyrhizobium sp. Ec3.3]|uniref:phage head-tail joining protein n=1 Tax=Bradyrhizobium sp. Ec3.3 TaxID=189753 RepID=UPI0003F9A4A5|nr:hypothetical protein [Bradyrhizobium sp. Ec3.3]
MADTTEQIQAKLTAIRTARDTGALDVRHGDTRTIFRSLTEMNAIIKDLESQLSTVQGTAPKKRIGYIVQKCKGL